MSGLHYAVWGPDDGPVVLAVHGITASHLAWLELAEAAPHLRIVAVDLRGRGASSTLPGPWGMERHAADVMAVLDELGIERATLVGHSMGAFVVAVTAHLFPERVAGVLLVDGGLTLPLPQGDVDPAKLLGPAAQRLEMTFESPGAYRDFWREHPALGAAWSRNLEAYLDYDLVDGRSRTSADAMRQDALELYGTPAVEAAVDALPVGTVLLWAPRGLLDETPGLYPPARLQYWHDRLPQLELVEVPDTNHYTIVMTPAGAAAIARYLP